MHTRKAKSKWRQYSVVPHDQRFCLLVPGRVHVCALLVHPSRHQRLRPKRSPIRSTLGVNQLVRFGAQPAKVEGQLINLVRLREQRTQAQPLFSAGDNVTVADGPFAGLEAIYQNTDAESRSMILLNILSKSVAMRIDTASLRKVG